ncbi:hypothetical protein ABT160_41260 [Streptomyces sp. NPDC001941]|uniref:hypothetical protein n=1 Tax=Streptomyces sp. NPDC001941 TaxID=3154659 RepID=UPI003316B5E0
MDPTDPADPLDPNSLTPQGRPDMAPARLAGTWWIVSSSFPMWLGGRRTGARFTYAPLPGGRAGAPRMSDRVGYRSGGRERAILGTDTRLTDRPGTVYRWRGKGLLAALSSVWEVTEAGPGDAWAVIAFSKSLATPAGHDVVVREEHLEDADVMADALAVGARYGTTVLAEFAPGI